MFIKRDYYLQELIRRKENGMVKVIAGLRRSGKSFLLFNLYHDYLVSNGTKDYHFTGTFDGEDHTISHMRISSTNDYVGFFGYISSATIRDVGLVDVSVAGNKYVGDLVGYQSSGSITDSFAANNYANSGMTLSDGIIMDNTMDGLDGADATLEQFKYSTFFSETAVCSIRGMTRTSGTWMLPMPSRNLHGRNKNPHLHTERNQSPACRKSEPARISDILPVCEYGLL